jgi:hypothetical protein
MADSLISADIEKDPVKVEFEKIQNLDNKTRQIYNRTSKKTLDLLHSLNSIKNNNKNLFGKGQAKDNLALPAPIDLLENLFDAESDAESKSKTSNGKFYLIKINLIAPGQGKPLLNKLKHRIETNPHEEVDDDEESLHNNPLRNVKRDAGERDITIRDDAPHVQEDDIKNKTHTESKILKTSVLSPQNMIRNFSGNHNEIQTRPNVSNGFEKSNNLIDLDVSKSNFNVDFNPGEKPKEANKDFLNSINDAFSINRKFIYNYLLFI